MLKPIKMLKIIILYVLCFAYIRIEDILEFELYANDFKKFVLVEGILHIAFYMTIILLVFSISLDKHNKLIDLLLLFIPAVIFLFSRFFLFIIAYVSSPLLSDILRYLMINERALSFAGSAILCGLIYKYFIIKINKKS